MSKIQLSQLNSSELEVLNNEATAEVVGGYGGYYGGYSSYYSDYYSSKIAVVDQANFNSNNQAAIGGGAFSNTSNFNSTNQNNNATISQ